MKKKFPLIFFTIVAVFSVYFFNVFFDKEEVVLRQMSGKVKNVNKNYVFVEGVVDGRTQVFEFIVSSSTALKRSEVGLTIDQIKEGGHQTPKTIIKLGSIADIKPGMTIILAKTSDNLLDSIIVKATEINYLVMDLPKL